MNVGLIGSVSSSWHTLRALIGAGVDIVGVCGLHPRHAVSVSDYHDLGQLAREHELDYVAFDKVTEPAVREFLDQRKPDLLFVIGLSQLVPKDMWSAPPGGSIGFHPTMLPKMRGRAPVAWTILLNAQPAVSLFFLTDQADAGDIVIQRPVPLLPDDYSADLIARTNAVLAECLAELAPAIRAGQLPRMPQDHSQATTLEKRTRSDGLIDWSEPTEQVYRLIRAASDPYPGAFTHVGDRELIVWRAEPWERPSADAAAGEVVDVLSDRRIVVTTVDGALCLTKLAWADTQQVATADAFRSGQQLGRAED